MRNGTTGALDDTATDITKYTWDYGNRMTSLTHYATYSDYETGPTAADIDISYTYDAFDRQVDESGTEGDASFDQRTIWDGGNPLGTLDGSDDVTQRFLDGPQSIRCWRWRRSAATIRA